jgi:SNF2 family DNA or RNA helicase
MRGEEAIAFVARLGTFRGEVRGSAHQAFFRAAELVPRLRLRGDDFSLDFSSGGEAAERGHVGGTAQPIGGAAAVLRAWREGESLVPLVGGGFAPLPKEWLAKHGQRVADLLAAKGEAATLPRAALPDLGRLAAELGEPPPPGLEKLRALLGDSTGLGEPALPEDLTATLRPYQRTGVAWLQLLRRAELGALLADDMGLGKTLQALCAIPSGVAAEGGALVVAPTSVLHNWMAELARFRPGLRASLYHGPKRRFDARADVTVTSYALLRLEAERFTARRWAVAILDEAQNVKNPESQVARAAHRLDARFRVALTGTPVENRLDELWSELRFATPGLLGSESDFAERTARPLAAGGPEGADAAGRLRERIRPFVLRRKKRDVAPELPPRTDLVLTVELDESERAVYDAVRAAARQEAVSALARGGNVLAALEALLRLRQAACHAALVPGQRAERSSKLDLLLEELETVVADGHKALVFSQWTSLLDLAEPELARAEIPHLRLDGSTRDRGAVVSAFQDEAGPPVLLVSLRAGGTGLNLTAADHVFLLDPWWNPAVEDQAADRAHRIGQERPVLVYRLVAKDTVEEGILALQERKRTLGELVVGEADGAAGLSREELAGLLEGA